MSGKLALEPLGWPEHDQRAWGRLANTAARTVWDGVFDGAAEFPARAAVETEASTESPAPLPDSPSGSVAGEDETASGQPDSDRASVDTPVATSGDGAVTSRSEESKESEADGSDDQRPPAPLLTVTGCRAAEALMHFVDAAPGGWVADPYKKAAKKVVEMVNAIDDDIFLSSRACEIELDGVEYQPLAVAALLALRARVALQKDCAFESELVATKTAGFIEALHSMVETPSRFDAVHPILVFHTARALGLAEYRYDDADEISRQWALLTPVVRTMTERLIARVMLGRRSPGDAVALAICAGAAPLVGDGEYVADALKPVLQFQNQEGVWLEGTTASPAADPDGGSEVTISSHEVAWVIAEGVLAASQASPTAGQSISSDLLAALAKSAEHAQRSVVDLGEARVPQLMGIRRSI